MSNIPIVGLVYNGKQVFYDDGGVVVTPAPSPGPVPTPTPTPPPGVVVPAELAGRTAFKQSLPNTSGFRLITPRPLGGSEYWQVSFKSPMVNNGRFVRLAGAAYRGDQIPRLWRFVRNSDNKVFWDQTQPVPTFSMNFTYGPDQPYIKSLPLNTDFTVFVWSPSGQVSDCYLDYYN